MNTLNKTMMLVALALPLHATGAFAGAADMSLRAINENAETCYQQFNSKSSFNASFKKVVGLTPSQFVRQNSSEKGAKS